ncbi:MAG TPA: complex I NDUFA9 subunit family protein [Rhizomicrobium sp.]|jgi:NADH dehydrogenase|nr:complex I NDUFA9 subunit family protein [Rhizomicrobium sp.]
MKTSLVTIFGGSGLLGRYAVRAFANDGWRIKVGVRHPNLAHYLPPMGHVGQILVSKADVTDAEAVAAAVRGSDVVVNLVGILYPGGGQTYNGVHIEAARSIGRAAKEAGVSTLIHVSTMNISPESESAYARSKAIGENALREEFPRATLIKPSLVFGPEDQFFNKFAGLARVLPFLPLVGGGHTKFQPVFAGDVADAIVKCASDPATRGNAYELGGPAVMTVKDMLTLILRETARTRPLIPIPFWLAAIQGFFLQFLPGKLLTVDQVKFLKTDNTVNPGALTLADLGIQPDALEAVVPAYLWRFRPKGQFEEAVRERVTGSPGTL